MNAPRRDRGQIIALFALSLLALVFLLGLVIDGGFAWVKRRDVQNGADFAALAATRVIIQNRLGLPRDDGDVAAAMVDTAAANATTIPGLGTASGALYTDGQGVPLSPVSFVGTTASSAAIPASAYGVRVNGDITWKPFVIGIVGVADWSAGAEATARFSLSGPSACGICILDGTVGTNSINMTVNNGSILVGGNFGASNSSQITANNGSIVVEGNLGGGNSQTFTANSGSITVGGNLTASNSSKVLATSGVLSVNGNLSFTNSTTAVASSINVQGTVTLVNSSSITPSPATHNGAVPISITDPLAALSDPTNPNPTATPQTYTCVNSCTNSFSPPSSVIASVTVSNSSTATITPGLYNRIVASNSSTVRLQPGTYYIAGTGGNMTADNSSRIVGLGAVTLVFLDQTSLSTANSTGLQITSPAPTVASSSTYPWPGVAIYAARGNTATFSIANSSASPVTGAIYARDGTLTTANSSPVAVQSLVVVGSYQSANSSSLTVTYNANQNPMFPSGARLVK